MKAPVDIIFPPVEPSRMPYWRFALRGCSQLCFQSNELTGLFFLAAVLVSSPIASAYFLVAALLAPGVRMLLRERRPVLATGLPGLNPSLIALSLPVFFQTGWTDFWMWGVLIVCVVCAVVLTRLCLAVLPFPTLALPFLLVFWGLYALAPDIDVLKPISFGDLPQTTFQPLAAVLHGLGQALFSASVWSGILFLVGMLLSNWRHALIAVFGAIIGTAVSYYYRDVDPASINLGLYGFNGVLTAVSVYVVCGSKLRLAVLGALLATIMMPAIADLNIQTLSAPFVFTTWLLLGLGWIEDKWFSVSSEPSDPAASGSGTASRSQPKPPGN